MSSNRILLLAVGLALVAVPAPAQEATSALLTLPTNGRSLAVGAAARGELTDADALWVDGSRVQAWALELAAGQTVWVDLVSDAFDGFLMAAGPGLGEGLQDDDSGGGCNARLTWTPAAAGTFHVIVNTVSAAANGAFDLRVSVQEPAATADGECRLAAGGGDLGLRELPIDARVLTVGREASGALDSTDATGPDGSLVEAWGLTLDSGQTVSIDLHSTDFDVFLWFVGPGLPDPLTDDDGAGGCDARITVTATGSGTFRVIANALMQGAGGAYTLHVGTEPGPVSEDSCGSTDEPQLFDFATLPVSDRRLRVGSKEQGALVEGDTVGPDGAFLDAWGMELKAAQSVTVDLISSAFDAYLRIAGPGLGEALVDDDGAGRCNSRITFTVPTDGIYRVIVSSVAPGAAGDYRLLVTAKPGPKAPGTCEG